MINKSKYVITAIIFILVSMVVLGGAHTGFSFSGSSGSVNIDWTAWGEFDQVDLNVTSDLVTTCYSPTGRVSNGRLRFRENYSWTDIQPLTGNGTGVKSYRVTINTDSLKPTPSQAGCPGNNGSVVVSGQFNFTLNFVGAQGAVDSWTGYCEWSWNSATNTETLGTCDVTSQTNNGVAN